MTNNVRKKQFIKMKDWIYLPSYIVKFQVWQPTRRQENSGDEEEKVEFHVGNALCVKRS